MICMNNIYQDIAQELYELGFDEEDLHGQKELIEQAFVNFTKHYFTMDISVTQKNLLSLLDFVPDDAIFDHYTHCLLNIIGSLQNYAVSWSDEEEVCTITRFNDGKFATLYTCGSQTSLEKFCYLYQTFHNEYNYIEDLPYFLQKKA